MYLQRINKSFLKKKYIAKKKKEVNIYLRDPVHITGTVERSNANLCGIVYMAV